MTFNRVRRFQALGLLIVFICAVLIFAACTDENSDSSSTSSPAGSESTAASAPSKENTDSRSLTSEEMESYLSRALSLIDDLDGDD